MVSVNPNICLLKCEHLYLIWQKGLNIQTFIVSGSITRYVSCACAGNAGIVSPATYFKWNRWLAIPTCITARASRTWPVVAGKPFPTFPVHVQPAIWRIWQEVHVMPTDGGAMWGALLAPLDGRGVTFRLLCTYPAMHLPITYICICIGGVVCHFISRYLYKITISIS